MSRLPLERELLQEQFPEYTNEVKKLIHTVQRANSMCSDTSDIVIDAIWLEFGRHFYDIVSSPEGERTMARGEESSRLNDNRREVLRTYIDKARDYEAALADMGDDEFALLYRRTIITPRTERDKRRQETGKERERWAFFNMDDAAADFDYWLRVDGWSPEEATALSMGKDPNKVNSGTLRPYKRVAVSPFREEFARRLNLINRAVKGEALSIPIAQSQFVTWASKKKFPLPLELREGVSVSEVREAQPELSESDQIRKLKDEISKTKSSATNKFNKLLQLTFALTYAAYKHNPYRPKPDIVRTICENAWRDLGLKLDEGTVLTRLNEAKDAIPPHVQKLLEPDENK